MQNYKKSGETPKFHPIYFFSFTLATFKNEKNGIWKNGNSDPGAPKAQRKLAPRVIKVRRNRNQGALKAQLHTARGETPGHGASSPITAPCKGNYINIEGCNRAIEESSCPYRAHFLYPYVFPGRCPGLIVVAPSGRGIPQWLRRGHLNHCPICNKILPKNGSLIFRKLGARKARILIFIHGWAAPAHREELCSFPKAPLLHSQSAVLGLQEHSIWYTKSSAFRVQERCFGNAGVVLSFGKSYTLLIHKQLC